jgi:Mrp family chromosome partitioning ATPase
MVIERALEKLRNSGRMDGGNPQRQDRRGTQPAASRRGGTRPLGPRNVAKLAFPVVEPDRATIANNRVMLPDVEGAGQGAQANAAYRMLRTRLMTRMRSNGWGTLAVTSPGPGEGKTLTTLNLAMSIAKDRSSDVFVIDLDMRNPSVCRYLGITPPVEITSFFEDAGSPADAFFSIGVDNLAIAGGTVSSSRASELVSSSRLEELLAYVRGVAFNPVILLDLPPLLVTDEALLVAPRVDATVLVVAEGRTRRDSLARAHQLLADFPFAGVVMNRSAESFGADSYYGYGYREGKSTSP